MTISGEGQGGIDRAEQSLERGWIERRIDDCAQQFVLVRERTEDGALGDSRRVGDLAGRHHLAVLEQERNGGLDDHRPPLVGRKRRGASSGRCHSHGARV